MTISDIVYATGINRITVYRHIRRGDLAASKDAAGRWYAVAEEVYSWACWVWEQGLCVMYPLERVSDHIRVLHEQRENNEKTARN